MEIDPKKLKTIQEKFCWLKLHDNSELKSRCSDKLELGKYCLEKFGEDISVPKLKIYDSPNDIFFSELPEKFVLKCNHGSGFNIVVNDKKNVSEEECRKKIETWLSTNYATIHGELFYSPIKRKSYAEKFLGEDILDYKFWCFNGIPKLYTINDGNGHGKILYFDMEKRPKDYYGILTNKELLKKYKQPLNFSKMVDYSKKLANDFKFVRIDYYEVNGKMYLGEMTFIPGAGIYKYSKREYDYEVGNLLEL